MGRYVGSKSIIVQSMSRKAYNDYRGWALPDDENGDDEGFLVEYLDGGRLNHPDHQGYISWSPKDVFDRAYIPSQAQKEYPDFVNRMFDELAQLDDKCQKAEKDVNNQEFIEKIGPAAACLLNSQLVSMLAYKSFLCLRIEWALAEVGK